LVAIYLCNAVFRNTALREVGKRMAAQPQRR